MSAWVLMLNDMRSSNIENLQAVMVSNDRQWLIDWHDAQRELWRDGRWAKAFREGSELEWFNPGTFEEDCEFFGGVYPVPQGMPAEVAMQLRMSKW